jgi:hypothetical protein
LPHFIPAHNVSQREELIFKSLSAGMVVALAFPFGWLLLLLLRFVSLGLPLREDSAIGLGAVAGKLAEMLIVGHFRA